MKWWRGKGKREKNLPFLSPFLYLFLSRPRISFRTAVSLTSRTTKEKTHQKTGTYAGCSTPWCCVSLAINLTAYFSASLLFVLRYFPSSEPFTVIHFRSVLETKRRRVREESE